MTLPNKGVALILAYLLGPLGADKFYVGATGQGVAMILITVLTLGIGLIVTIPWAMLSVIALVVATLWGGLPFLYPNVQWAPTTQNDTIIAWIVIGLSVLGMIVGILRRDKIYDVSKAAKSKAMKAMKAK